MDYKEFRLKLMKADAPKKSKVRNSWGVYNAYKQIRKNGWYDIGRPLKEHEFYSIIRGINNLLAKEIVKGNTVKFPHNMGELELRKFKPEVKIVDGKLKIGYPINWDKTIKLWYKDEEAKKNKILLRYESKYLYHIKYSRHHAMYENQVFYEFEVNKFIKRALAKSINNGKTDTLW
nr:MAG TPA: hypothetical protein [Crassvirales sp.]